MRASVVIGRLFVVWRLSAATSLVTSRHSFPDMDPAEFIQSKIYLRNEMEEFVETHCKLRNMVSKNRGIRSSMGFWVHRGF